MDVIFADMCFDEQTHRRTDRRQAADRSRRTKGAIAYAIDIDDRCVGLQMIDKPRKLGGEAAADALIKVGLEELAR